MHFYCSRFDRDPVPSSKRVETNQSKRFSKPALRLTACAILPLRVAVDVLGGTHQCMDLSLGTMDGGCMTGDRPSGILQEVGYNK